MAERKMNEKKVKIESQDGTPLCGILLSDPRCTKGVAVLAHGITVEKNEGGFYTKLAKVLADGGLQSLRFDFRGHGESGGRPEEMTIQGEVEDLEAAVSHVRELSPKRLSIVATSFGAGIAILYTERRPETVSSVVLLAPVLDYNRTFLAPETEWAQEWFTEEALKRAKENGTLDLDGFPLGRKLLEEFKVFDPGEVLLRLTVPTLIIHGTDDSMVPYDVARRIGSKYIHGRFLSIEDADHGFEGSEDRVFSEVKRWILEHLDE